MRIKRNNFVDVNEFLESFKILGEKLINKQCVNIGNLKLKIKEHYGILGEGWSLIDSSYEAVCFEDIHDIYIKQLAYRCYKVVIKTNYRDRSKGTTKVEHIVYTEN